MKKDTLGFQAEVKQLLQLVTHSLYSNREIFLRELISNASDAADKLRFEALSNPEFYEDDGELKIWIDIDTKARTITVRDNGIGMSRDEVIANLGTIAKSGTREFLNSLSAEQMKDTKLIGQFGVGFYSSFVVAEKVTVRTRRAGLDKKFGVVWESTGEGDFSVADIEKVERGTEITLHIKKDDADLLDHWKIRQIITKYSDHIVLPIVMKKPLDEKQKVAEDEVVNRATALWTLPKSEIKDEEYRELYHHVSHDFEDPLLWSHNRVEGKLEYITLLYIPQRAPFDFWTRDKKRGIRLYVQRVFIMDDAEQLLPNYLRFVQGIVDSKDLPLNVSREILQNNRVIEQIRAGIVKRVLDMLDKLATQEPEKYAKFWQAFGNVLKEGMVEDPSNRDTIAKLLRFASTKNNGDEQNVTLDDYLGRMPREQEQIYYIGAESFSVAKNSPHLEVFIKNDIEVLLLSDRIDEWWLTHYREYQGKKLQSITKGDVDLAKLVKNENVENRDKLKEEYADIIKKMKNDLGEKVSAVRLSDRLTDSPVCIVTTEDDLSYNMQRIMSNFGQEVPKSKPILELNPGHPLVRKLQHLEDDELFSEWSHLFYEQALLLAGGKLDDLAAFARRMNRLLTPENPG